MSAVPADSGGGRSLRSAFNALRSRGAGGRPPRSSRDAADVGGVPRHRLLAFPAVAYVFVVFCVPVAILFAYSFWPTVDGQIVHAWTLDNYTRVFESSTYTGTLLRTFWFVGLCSLATVVLTFPFAYFVATKVAPKRRVLWLLVAVVPFFTSYLLRVFAWLNLLGDEGAINDVLRSIGLIDVPLGVLGFGRPAIGITFVYLLFPLSFLTTYISLERVNPALFESAADLGAGPLRALTRITLPMARSGLLAGFVFSFITMAGDYATPTLIGGTGGTMYANLVVNQFGASQQWGFGATLAFVLLLAIVAMLFAMRKLGGGVQFAGEYTRAHVRRRAPFLRLYSLAFLGFLYLPIALVILFSLNTSKTIGLPIEGITLEWFSSALDNTLLMDSLWTSIQVAGIAVGLSLLLGVPAAVQLSRARGRLRALRATTISLPLFLPPIVLGLAIIIALNAFGMQRGLWTVVVGHLVLVLPIVTLLLVVRLEGLDMQQELAALDLGAKPWQVFVRVTVPQALPGILAAAMIGFAVSMDEFILTFLVSGTEATLPLYVYSSLRFVISPELTAVASMMLLLSFLLIGLGAALMSGRNRRVSRRSSRKPTTQARPATLPGE